MMSTRGDSHVSPADAGINAVVSVVRERGSAAPVPRLRSGPCGRVGARHDGRDAADAVLVAAAGWPAGRPMTERARRAVLLGLVLELIRERRGDDANFMLDVVRRTCAGAAS